MSGQTNSATVDPVFRDYRFAKERLVSIYDQPGGREQLKVFMGEWLKQEAPPVGDWVAVKFRGGRGFVKTAHLGTQRLLEIFFIDVDQGDSILIQTPKDRRILIDGGQTKDALSFVENKYRLDKEDNYIDFEAVVATHSDQDHTLGLIALLRHPKILVKRVYHNGLFRRAQGPDPGPRQHARVSGLVDTLPTNNEKASLTPLMKDFVAAIEEARDSLPAKIKAMKAYSRWQTGLTFTPADFVCQRLDAAMGFLPPFDAANPGLSLQVLWPKATTSGGLSSYPWYGDAGKTVNGNSVVLKLTHGRTTVLLTGDLNEGAMNDILAQYRAQPDALVARVYKAAHHGSQHFSVDFLKTVCPDAAVISSGDDRLDQHGHPRAVLLGTITRYSGCDKPAVFSTELARCYQALSNQQKKAFRADQAQLYERAIQGVVHLRSDGQRLFLGTVHGRKAPRDPLANTDWKWDVWPE